MISFIKKILHRKLLSAIIALLLIIGGYYGYGMIFKKDAAIRYVTAPVQKGALIVSISGSGQVAVSDQSDVKPEVSGEIVYVGVKNDQQVKTGALLAKIDTRDAEKAVRDAETALETAKLELEELLNPPDELTLLQAENSLSQTKESKQKAEDSLVKSYEDGFNAAVNAFSDLPSVMIDMEDVLYGNAMNRYQDNIAVYADMVRSFDARVDTYKDEAADSYTVARAAYDQNFQDYKAASRYSDNATIAALVNETYETTKAIAEAIKNADNLLSFTKDTLTLRNLNMPTTISTHQSTIRSDTSKTNSILSNLLSIKTAIKSARESIVDAGRSITEKELSLKKFKAGADELTIRAKKITVQQKEDALLTAKQNLTDCYIRASSDGIIIATAIKKGDSVSTGTTLFSIITEQKIAEISLNEVDAAKVKVGQKATLTFDALPELSISGKVLEVDTVGQVSQGVVSYGVKIILDTQNEEVKSGMSVTADIITDAKQDVLLVANSAVKQQGEISYIEVMINGAPQRQTIEIGISNDLDTEIVSGLKEGDMVVTNTINPQSTTSTTQQQNSSFRIPGLTGGGDRGFQGAAPH